MPYCYYHAKRKIYQRSLRNLWLKICKTHIIDSPHPSRFFYLMHPHTSSTPLITLTTFLKASPSRRDEKFVKNDTLGFLIPNQSCKSATITPCIANIISSAEKLMPIIRVIVSVKKGTRFNSWPQAPEPDAVHTGVRHCEEGEQRPEEMKRRVDCLGSISHRNWLDGFRMPRNLGLRLSGWCACSSRGEISGARGLLMQARETDGRRLCENREENFCVEIIFVREAINTILNDGKAIFYVLRMSCRVKVTSALIQIE